MHKEVSLKINDGALSRAVSVMLLGLGYAVSSDAPTVITDMQDFQSEARVIYIGRDEAPRGRLWLRRPVDGAELDDILKALDGERPQRKEYGIRIDKKRSVAVLDGEKITMTEKEMQLLSLLHENAGKTVTDEQILERVWKNETVQGSNIVAVYIKYLREKLDERVGRRLIFRVRSEGYMLKLKEKE